MGKKREQHLRKQRERAARKNPPAPKFMLDGTPPDYDPPPTQVRCRACGFEGEIPTLASVVTVYAHNEDRSKIVDLGGSDGWLATCPRCQQPADIVNMHSEFVGDRSYMSPANTDAERDRFGHVIEALRGLGESAEIDVIADEIEASAPELRTFAEWLRRNQELFNFVQAVGVPISIIVSLVAIYLQMSDEGPAPVPEPPPAGITNEQFDRLLSQLDELAGPDDAAGVASGGGRPGGGGGGPVRGRGPESAARMDDKK